MLNFFYSLIRKTAFSFFLFVFFSFGIINADSFAKDSTPKPLRTLLTYDDFESLLRFNVGRVPNLLNLWNGSARADTSDVFWGGGGFRGFLHWHYLQLQEHSPEQLKRMRIPTLEQMLLLGSVDADIFGPASAQEAVETVLSGVSHVDYIQSENIAEFVKLGGATLEKSAINPYRVLDPLHGVRHYYEGRLVFQWARQSDLNSLWFKESDYSRTAEAIRYIRFLRYNLPELAADPWSVASIRRIARFEHGFIQQEDRLAWIEICLEKLIAAAQGHLYEVLSLLHEYNLLGILAQAEVQIPSEAIEVVMQWLQDHHSELTVREVDGFGKMMGSASRGADPGNECGNALGNPGGKIQR